jgi:hypothetical protein
VKTATEQPAPGQVVETTTRKRILPIENSPETKPELWTYLESLDSNPQEWDRHIVYIYRTEPSRSDGTGTLVAKCTRTMTFPDGSTAELSDQEGFEYGMLKNYGGKAYRLIVKRGHERIVQGRVYIDAPPRTIAPMLESSNGNGAGATVTAYSDATQIANKAIDTVASQDALGIKVAAETLSAMGQLQAHTANVLKNFNANPTPPPAPPENPLVTQLIAVVLPVVGHLIERMLNPPDPLKQLRDTLVVMREINPGNGTPAAPAVSAGAELVRTLPQVAMTVVDGMREWRGGVEAQRDTVLAARSPIPIPTGPPPQPQARVLLPTPAPNPPPNGAAAVSQPSPEFIQGKIVEILKEPVSAEQAADDTLAFLSVIDEKLVDYLAGLGETGLVNLFQTSPTLKPATVNMPRLLDFIRAFLKMYNQDKEADANERKPN